MLLIVPMLLITTRLASTCLWQLVVAALFFIFVSGRFIPSMALVTAATTPQLRGRVMSFNSAVQNLFTGLAAADWRRHVEPFCRAAVRRLRDGRAAVLPVRAGVAVDSVQDPHVSAKLAVTSLAAERGGRAVFDGLSFTAEAGTLLRVPGANGASKTTLLRILPGLPAPAAGEVRWQADATLAPAQAASYVGHGKYLQRRADGGRKPRLRRRCWPASDDRATAHRSGRAICSIAASAPVAGASANAVPRWPGCCGQRGRQPGRRGCRRALRCAGYYPGAARWRDRCAACRRRLVIYTSHPGGGHRRCGTQELVSLSLRRVYVGGVPPRMQLFARRKSDWASADVLPDRLLAVSVCGGSESERSSRSASASSSSGALLAAMPARCRACSMRTPAMARWNCC